MKTINPIIINKLHEIIPSDRILSDLIQRLAYANDASFYSLIPEVVIQPETIDEVRALFKISHDINLPLTFRAAGTSLSGQAISSGILVELSKNWKEIKIFDNAERVYLEPGVIGKKANDKLRAYQKKIGPDPASINSCMVGGIIANNASGMCCGVKQNAYHTLEHMTFVMPDQTVIDTSQINASEYFERQCPELVKGLIAIRDEIEKNDDLKQRIILKYQSKNTTGYSINSFVDFKKPLDIFKHLLVGSEGTLAFIANVTLKTVDDFSEKLTGFIVFDSIFEACQCVNKISQMGASAVELMDYASLYSVKEQLKKLEQNDFHNHSAALLFEFHSDNSLYLEEKMNELEKITSDLRLSSCPILTRDTLKREQLWNIRKGLFPSVGAIRKSGTSVIIEDILFPTEKLPQGVLKLQELFSKYNYEHAIIFGHAKDGNLHFVITQSFNTEKEISRYQSFIDDLVHLVVNEFKGALKAEHGTGRNMAPFVEAEWGNEAYEIMKRIKKLVDPDNLLNPGVIINQNPLAHIQNLKSFPKVESEIDTCIECGFCESVCPSNGLTLSPRQRIVIRRELSRQNDIELIKELNYQFKYYGLETCATDGLCATKCPVSIDTGHFVKIKRQESNGVFQEFLAKIISKNFLLFCKGLKLVLTFVRLFPDKFINFNLHLIRKVFKINTPKWLNIMPIPSYFILKEKVDLDSEFVYFPSCLTRNLKNSKSQDNLVSVFMNICKRAKVKVNLSAESQKYCCGMPFASKGFKQAHKDMANKTIEFLWRFSNQGKKIIVIDTSPCAYSLKTIREVLSKANQDRYDHLIILDSIEFMDSYLIDKLKISKTQDDIVIHPVCSVVKMGLEQKLVKVMKACCKNAEIPENSGCCGFAGDRGLFVPELTKHALKLESKEISMNNYSGHYSSSLMCELGLTNDTENLYSSYLYYIDKVTKNLGS